MVVVTFLPSGSWTPRSRLQPQSEPAESNPPATHKLGEAWQHAQAIVFNTLERFPDAFEAVRLALARACDPVIPIPESGSP